MRDRSGTLTFAETRRTVRAVAGGLRQVGVRPGERVAVLLERPREAVLAWLATGVVGAVEVPVNPELFGDRLRYVLAHSGSVVAVVEEHLLSRLDELAEGLSELRAVVVVGEGASRHLPTTSFDDLLLAEPWEGEDPVDPGRLAALLYTSGSTGPPKAAMVPHGQHYMNAFQAARAAGISSADTVFLCLPLHHNMAQGYGVAPALLAGAQVHLAGRFDRRAFWREIAESGATTFPFVGAMLALLAGQDLAPPPHRLRVGYGIPVSKAMHDQFADRFGVRLVHCYGSTEATIVTWSDDGTDRVATPGSCGWTVPEFEVELQDECGRAVPTGATGEICVRPREPASMFLGYHDDPARTVEVLRGLWFHTGDRGRFDDDGELWFEGRTEDVIRRFGEFIAASEVEDVFEAHEAVQQAVAVGVPSEVVGEEVLVAVTLREPSSVSAAELWAWARERMPRYAVPRYVDIVADLPMTTTGKVQKHVLRSAGPSGSTYDARQTEGK
ncbi:ATP-dependent acyl-CoA ligase [Nocardioides humi]|uniref:ATP-dependent acyl-CoA ligase n=1 Tax=Nocardioides humi TaxID=449461 RepID=A0ABN2AEE5_9ACTN